MFTGLREQISPTILAVATILVVISIALLITLEMLRRRSERLRGITPSWAKKLSIQNQNHFMHDRLPICSIIVGDERWNLLSWEEAGQLKFVSTRLDHKPGLPPPNQFQQCCFAWLNPARALALHNIKSHHGWVCPYPPQLKDKTHLCRSWCTRYLSQELALLCSLCQVS